MLRNRPSALAVRACAKINLGWTVGVLRDDNYHEVQGVMQTISLCDVLRFSPSDTEAHDLVAVDVADAPELNDENLIHVAAGLIADRAPNTSPVRVEVEKNIPIAAGLGGGSADAAAALVGLNLFWRAGLSAGDLLKLATKVGSDVAPILRGGLVHCSGRGEVARSVGSSSGYEVVVVVPDATLETPKVYARLDELRSLAPASPSGCNELAEAARNLCPAIREAETALTSEGARPVFVSGSGPAVVGIITNGHAETVAMELKKINGKWAVHSAEPSAWGVKSSFVE